MKDMLIVTKRHEANKSRTNAFYYLTIFCVVFGNSVGIALFVFQYSAILACKNPIILLIVYAFIGIVCLSLILVCLELITSQENKFNTIPHWLRNFLGRQAGSISALFYSFVYMPAIISTLALISWGFVFNLFDSIMGTDQWMNNDVKAVLIIVLSAISIIGLILFNAYSEKYKEWVIIILNVIKLIPVLLIIISCILAFILGKTWDGLYNSTTDNSNNFFVMLYGTTSVGTDNWGLGLFIGAMPIVMLSFDGFLHGISVSNDKEHSKIVSSSSFIAVITVIVLNILIVGLLMGTTTDLKAITLFGKILPKWCMLIIGFLFCFCILGSIIGFGSYGTNNYYTASDPNVEGGQLFGTKSGWQYSYESAAWRQLIIYIIFLILIWSVSYPLNRQFISFDPTPGAVNFLVGNACYNVAMEFAKFVVVVSFIFYTLLIFCLVINRFTKKREVKKMIGAGVFGLFLTPILWFFCGYIIVKDIWDISFFFQKPSNRTWNSTTVDQAISSAFAIGEFALYGLGILRNELKIKKNKFDKIFAS